ncbi:unnamed protein product [Cylindrotheca closterium]|uniref:Uncharacterized protein n=1 Tax=Cylindrotheca closterium TaxID=2856 RepID=A0AAD2CI51_9STRA|nr:unnamed protein product [Cylindrotheca closterium]
MASALEQFMKGMISNKSKECGFRIDCVLIVDNAVPDSESHYECESVRSQRSVASAAISVATAETADMTVATSAAPAHKDLDLSDEHIRMLRWSASMGVHTALTELKAVEGRIAERDAADYEKKLRWSAAMGDTTSMAKLNAGNKSSRWSAGCAADERKPVPSKRSLLMQPKRRPSFRLSSRKLAVEEEEPKVVSSRSSLKQPKRRPSFRLPKISFS